jgi:hypothetical protein
MAHSQNHYTTMGANEMENLVIRFLTSLASLASWRDTISFVNDHHQTLAHLAVLFRYIALLEKLVEWGVDLDVQDMNGWTALHCAYLCENWECVRILRCAGADEDLEDDLGRLPVDIFSPRTSYTRASTPSSSDGTSSPARIPSDGAGDWENIHSATFHPCNFEVSGTAKDQPASGAHTSDSRSRGKPLVSISSPSSDNSNESWVQEFDENVRILDSPTDPIPSAPSALLQSHQVTQASRSSQHATSYPLATSVSRGSFHLHAPTRELAEVHHSLPGIPPSDLTPTFLLPFSPVMNYRAESSSDLSSASLPSQHASPMSTPSPMPPNTPLQSSWPYLNPQMHRPDSSASHHQNMLQTGFETRVQRLPRPSPSPSHMSIRYDPPPHPPSSWPRFGTTTPYHPDEKTQKEVVDERKMPPPPLVHESGYSYTPHSKVEKDKKQFEDGGSRQNETTKANAGWMSAEKERGVFVRRFADQALTATVDGAKGQVVDLQQRDRHHYTKHGNS